MNNFMWKDFTNVPDDDCISLAYMLMGNTIGIVPDPDEEHFISDKWIIGFNLKGFNCSYGEFHFEFSFYYDLDKIGYRIRVCFANGIMFDLLKCNLDQNGLDPIPDCFVDYIEEIK